MNQIDYPVFLYVSIYVTVIPEDENIGIMEKWKDIKLECWKDGIMESWKG